MSHLWLFLCHVNHLAIVDPVRSRKMCFIVTGWWCVCYHQMYTGLLNRQVRHFLLSVTSHLPQMCVNVCLRVCSIRPHLPPTDDFGDGCHGDASNAADELIGCICLSLPMGDYCVMIHHGHRAAEPGAFVSTELLTVQAALGNAAAARTAVFSRADDGQHEARPQALCLRRPAEGLAAQTQLCPGDPLLLLPQSHGGRQREPASASHWAQDQEK